MTDQELLNENIISLLGLESLPVEQKIAMVEKMSQLIEKRAMAKVLSLLPAEDQDTLLKHLETNNTEEIGKIMSQKVQLANQLNCLTFIIAFLRKKI